MNTSTARDDAGKSADASADKGAKARSRKQPESTFSHHRSVKHFHCRMDHHLRSDGTIERTCVLPRRIRDLLDRPRRQTIEPLKISESRWTLSDVWEMVDRTATQYLKDLYDQAAKRESAASSTRKRPGTAVIAQPTPLPYERVLPVVRREEASGKYLGTTLHSQLGAYLDLYGQGLNDDEPQLLRYHDANLIAAVEELRIREDEYIRVIPNGQKTFTVDEHNSGAFGEGRRQFQHSRQVFQIVRDQPPTRALPALDTKSGRTAQWRGYSHERGE